MSFFLFRVFLREVQAPLCSEFKIHFDIFSLDHCKRIGCDVPLQSFILYFSHLPGDFSPKQTIIVDFSSRKTNAPSSLYYLLHVGRASCLNPGSKSCQFQLSDKTNRTNQSWLTLICKWCWDTFTQTTWQGRPQLFFMAMRCNSQESSTQMVVVIWIYKYIFTWIRFRRDTNSEYTIMGKFGQEIISCVHLMNGNSRETGCVLPGKFCLPIHTLFITCTYINFPPPQQCFSQWHRIFLASENSSELSTTLCYHGR